MTAGRQGGAGEHGDRRPAGGVGGGGWLVGWLEGGGRDPSPTMSDVVRFFFVQVRRRPVWRAESLTSCFPLCKIYFGIAAALQSISCSGKNGDQRSWNVFFRWGEKNVLFFFSAERITFKCWTQKDVYSLLILQRAPTGCFIKHTGTWVAVEWRHTVYTGLPS